MRELADYPIAIIDDAFGAATPVGRVVGELVAAFEARGHRVLTGLSFSDAGAGRVLYTGLAAVLIGIDGFATREALVETLTTLLDLALARAPDLPVFLYGERRLGGDLPTPLMRWIDGYLYLHEDTPGFIAGYVSSAIHRYLDAMLPPFFKALVRYTDAAKYSWHTPGHGGGVAFMRSPVGQAFHRFFGETTLRADLSVSVPELGSLLDHTGPVREAEREAALSFGADATFFVTNGTSSANKIVWSGLVGPGDHVLVDRNCHKSLVHALIMTGATPVYLLPSRNAYGIIGPIPRAAFDAQTLAARLPKGARLRVATITNSTYDGLCINTDVVKQALSPIADAIHFDEAWLAQARFHEFYAGFYAMSPESGPVAPLVFSTQFTHKVLAAFSQASMIHVKSGTNFQLDPDRFNEAFMMHASTSPWYGIIASCDVAARMMRGSAGRTLVDETLTEAADFRAGIARLGAESRAAGAWWFRLWEPENAGLAQQGWTLKPNDAWHGFADVTEGVTLLDPMKVTILCPGLEEDQPGIPAPIVAKFLWSRGIVVEKIGIYHFLILFTLGVTRGKWSNLITELLAFRAHYQANTPLADVLPDLVKTHPARYERMGLADLCRAQHQAYREGDILALQNAMFETLPEPAMTPQMAHAALIGNRVEPVGLDELPGRIVARMVVPYPPGIPLIFPGERVSVPAMIRYLRFAEAWDRRFPGFETDIHGARKTPEGSYQLDCVV
ncbi:Orn/Lys/Arg decarboxylase N-terminal domain-containing protein [Acidocella sp.]|uniref:Orn/Lys/Arg family decarboxylase n=1 Tax=Acidocella sp. TaxID=50710 RepID=UPI0026054A42|nr:Orn/Lys/Arg decarboxylase N-terminal domain-containing protein [Acidocella sp.]